MEFNRKEVKLNQKFDDQGLGLYPNFHRVSVFDHPTDIEYMKNLSKWSGISQLYVKRDDCNNLAFGGNKVRQVEYYFGDAKTQGADTIMITGAVQSNFVRITAALAAKLGLKCHIQLESRVTNDSSHYHHSGNVLLDRLFGAQLHYYDEGEDEFGADARLREIAEDLKISGLRPYIIPLAPGHKPLGALGYVRAAIELKEQLSQRNLEIDEIYVASGSGNTHAGLLFGLRAIGMPVKVVGVCVRRESSLQWERIRVRCHEIANLLQVKSSVEDDDIIVLDEHFFPGYGEANSEVWDGILLAARKEALILDPTYSGKAMAALLKRVRSENAPRNMLFIHTGGTPGIYGYQDQFEHALLNWH